MERTLSPEKVMNGTFGEVWLDDYYLAEVLSLEAKASLEKTEVNQARTLVKGYKVTGIDCKGTLKLNKVTSYFLTKLSESIKKGKVVKCTIISKLADPDSDGIERVKLTGCVFDEITLANWEVKKLGEESIPFTFTGWEVLDYVPAQ
ncbi:phage tail tube protein [Catonella massiliensis]|jgi:hypothetical protein|uniref:Phage tail tube protein n=1 Tax=Catonella massiliensis TaxID=2799636 RepID=A0ABS1J3N6_9FIRM|nr:phage tail tube protein [Catonella massiliensis]MBK5898665.1 phage tail tube protein [Catonella massiliensis]